MHGLTHGFHNLLNGIKEREIYTFIFRAFLCHKQRVDIIEPPKYEFYLFRSFICNTFYTIRWLIRSNSFLYIVKEYF